MMRIVCAWSLLLLAASPFTAPFATCDLGALLGHIEQIIPPGQSLWCIAGVRAGSDAYLANTDAYSISPLTTRTELAREPAFTLTVSPARAFDRVDAAAVCSPHDLNQSP